MTTILIAIGSFVIGAVSGSVFSYLFLRANAQKKAVLDALTAKVAAKL